MDIEELSRFDLEIRDLSDERVGIDVIVVVNGVSSVSWIASPPTKFPLPPLPLLQ